MNEPLPAFTVGTIVPVSNGKETEYCKITKVIPQPLSVHYDLFGMEGRYCYSVVSKRLCEVSRH